MKLSFFSDRNYLLEGMEPDPMLYPFWPEFYEERPYSWFKAYEQYIEVGGSLFEATDLEAADFAVLPANWRTIRGDSWRSKINQLAQTLSLQFAALVQQAGKPLVVFFSGDCSSESLPIKNVIAIRQGLYRSQRKQNDFVMPAFVEDLVKYYCNSSLPIRQKPRKPTVGFCGLSRRFALELHARSLIYHGTMMGLKGQLGISPYKGEAMRHKLLNLLSNSSLLDTNFIVRERSVFLNGSDYENKQKTRAEFVQNMVSSDYILNCRGSGNYSHRLIETLCCGRIPIFVDTDCVLPYDFAIDWKQYCIWIDEAEIPYIADIVADFHDRISPQEFVDLQYECRQLWQKWLSPEGFFSNFYRHFEMANQELNPISTDINLEPVEAKVAP